MPDPVSLSSTPTDLVAEASLVLGGRYVVQADTSDDGDSPVYLKEQAAAPTDPTQDVDQILGHLERLTVEPETKLWATVPVGRKRGRLLIAASV